MSRSPHDDKAGDVLQQAREFVEQAAKYERYKSEGFTEYVMGEPALTFAKALVAQSAVARSDLADELARLGSKATQGPWSSNILKDFRGHSGSNDTPYVYGPESHPKLLMGLWPIHPPEETAAVEQRMFDTLDLICALRNHLPEIIAALRTQSAIGRCWRCGGMGRVQMRSPTDGDDGTEPCEECIERAATDSRTVPE